MPNSPSDPARSPSAVRSGAPSGVPDPASGDARRVTVRRKGPMLVEGPVEVELEDGSVVSSDRFRVALCTCRRSRRYPWCDTSHRDRA
ncbi:MULTISPECIES: CDGSH iron-sulfur domain-containing protein [unclassified Streptomyces]|uniref:CDGSH iron-sulfur domain-containing protein n=1 Tax=unclassified Streptomyces TaxID=2593676 RepID=UPI00268D241C